jgi:class 3 adenylate cyclase
MLRVLVLGELALELDGEALELPASKRARSLLGLLAVERRVHPRGQLAPRFWPDVLDESARTSLRSALSALRRSLGPDADRYLIAGRETVALAGPDAVTTDLDEFEALIAGDRVEEALALCRGDLLAGLDDEWVYERRDEHAERVGSALERLAAEAEEAGDLASAVSFTRRRAALDPLAEDAQRDLIRRMGAAGDRAGAIAAYRRLQDRLRSELGIAPSALTRELVESLRREEAEAPAPAPASAAPPAERAPGTVTLLFTDQVSSTETLQRLGDDEAERLRRTHFRLLRDTATAHGGQEVKNLGDGLMVAFTSAVDAVACAIGIQQAVHRHAEREGDDRLSVRVGLNVGEPIRDEDDYFGTPVVVAKRLCDAADAGQILASDVVRMLVGTRGGFDFRPLGSVSLKGIADPVPACEVGWEPTTSQRIPLPPAVAVQEASTFVGREDAMATLEREWAEAADGRRRVALLAGEPGIGKTRLAAEFARAVHERGAAVLAGRCYEEMLVPYQPFTEALGHYAAGCPPAELAVQVASRRRELATLVPELADAAGGVEQRSTSGDAGQDRFRLFDAVATLLSEAARARPSVLLLDDLQWADAASLQLLRHVVRVTESAPLMVLATVRATELEPGSDLVAALAEMRRARALTEVRLPGLQESEVAELISVQSGAAAGEAFVRGVARRTDGNPFFIEELMRHVDDPAAWRDDESSLPESVKDLLRRRLDRLGDDCRQALSVAAVAGREFDLEVVARVQGTSADALLDLLDGAVAGQVLVEEPGGFGRYAFAHPLIRETIHQELSATRRALMHRRVGEAIEAVFADSSLDRAGELAHHFHAAGDAEKAFDYHRQAADAAERVYAVDTAVEHLSGAVAAGELLGRTPQNDAVLRDLARRLGWLRGFEDPDRARVELEVVLEAARASGDRVTEMHVLNGLGALSHIRDLAASIEYHEGALRIAEELGDELGQVSALNRLSIVHSNLMDFESARELGERALALARRSGNKATEARAMDCLKLVALQIGDTETLEDLTTRLERVHRAEGDVWYLQWTLLEGAFVPISAGRYDEAAARLDEAMSLYERVSDPWPMPLVLNARSWLERARGDYGAALAAGRAAVERAHLRDDTWLGWVASVLGHTLGLLRELPVAAEVLERGLAAADRWGAPPQVFCSAGELAWVRWRLGDEDAARGLAGRVERLLDDMRVPDGHAHLYSWGGYTGAASVALAAGDADRAEAIVGRFLEPAERFGVRDAAADGWILLGRCAELRGDREAAATRYARGLDATTGGGLHEQRRASHTALARLAAAAGDGQAAGAHEQSARELVDAIAASVGDDQLAAGFRNSALAELDAAAAGRTPHSTS